MQANSSGIHGGAAVEHFLAVLCTYQCIPPPQWGGGGGGGVGEGWGFD